MIEVIELIVEIDPDKFMEDLQTTVLELQSRGFIVSIQYSRENYKNIAFITGRTKNNV